MKKKTIYKQCVLQNGNSHQTAWIPSRLAQIAKELKIQNSQGEWECGWIVIAVGRGRDDIPNVKAMIRRHRHATGDDTPKVNGHLVQ